MARKAGAATQAVGNTFVLSGLHDKRARLAGEIIQAQEVSARRTEELLAIDAVLRLFSPDCDPDMIAPIRTTSHGLYFQYKELGRLCLDALRRAGKSATLNQVVNQRGADQEATARQSLLRQARNGPVRLPRLPVDWDIS